MCLGGGGVCLLETSPVSSLFGNRAEVCSSKKSSTELQLRETHADLRSPLPSSQRFCRGRERNKGPEGGQNQCKLPKKQVTVKRSCNTIAGVFKQAGVIVCPLELVEELDWTGHGMFPFSYVGPSPSLPRSPVNMKRRPDAPCAPRLISK